MSHQSVMTPRLPWSPEPEAERRFRRITLGALVLSLLAGVTIPWFDVPEPEFASPVGRPLDVVKLVLIPRRAEAPNPRPKRVEKPVPKPKPRKLAKSKPRPKPKPGKVARARPKPKPKPKAAKARPRVAPKRVASAKPKAALESTRQRVARAGLLAFADDLAALRETSALRKVKADRPLSRAGNRAQKRRRSLVTAGVAKGSGGIDTSRLSRDTGGVELAGRDTAKITSALAGNAPVSRVGSGKGARRDGKAGRSREEIQWVFDRNKGAIHALYDRALRADPTLQGKVVVELTIAPSGKVKRVRILSSGLNARALERKLLARIRMFDFGAKDVETVVVTYPIDFLPS